ncbi:MAG: histidinol-phosphate transaminase [Candidatus Bathyarchaeia archaeon]
MKSERSRCDDALKPLSYEDDYIYFKDIDGGLVKLDLNENFLIDENFMRYLLASACKDVDPRIYPPPRGKLAVTAIAEFYGLDEEMVVVGSGVDELLDLISKKFVVKGANTLIVEPTYYMYSFFVNLYKGNKIDVLLKPNFELDVDRILSLKNNASLLILCSPNNPTGNQFNEDDVKALLEEFKGLIVIDETYVEFAKYSLLPMVKKFDNLIVLRTFSKAFGMAGMRAGFIVANPSVTRCLREVMLPFNVNTVTQKMIVLALKNYSYFKGRINQIICEREWLFEKLRQIEGVKPYPSDTNFILTRITKGEMSSSNMRELLRKKNVLVRDRGASPLLDNCIRVSVGTRKMNKTFLNTLEEVLKNVKAQ